MLKDVLEYFPEELNNVITNFLKSKNIKEIEEIRLRINQNISLKIGQSKIMLPKKITNKSLEEVFENICEKSIYTYTKQISEGFITIKGGNRVGIVGSPVIDNEKIININYISSLNFRIAKEIKDVSIPFLKYIIDLENNTIFNTIIASPPGGGKTTLLRDLTRKISNRNRRNRFSSKNMYFN